MSLTGEGHSETVSAESTASLHPGPTLSNLSPEAQARFCQSSVSTPFEAQTITVQRRVLVVHLQSKVTWLLMYRRQCMSRATSRETRRTSTCPKKSQPTRFLWRSPNGKNSMRSTTIIFKKGNKSVRSAYKSESKTKLSIRSNQRLTPTSAHSSAKKVVR